jgi:predicted nucleic acid-binding protein
LKPRRTSRLREPATAYLPDAFVVDCSVCLPWYIEDEASEFCAGLAKTLGLAEIWVPSLWRPELVSALVNAERRKRMTSARRDEVVKNAAGLPLRIDYEMPTVVELNELAAGHHLTPYDAVYFELARRRKLPLATLDAALVKAARAAKLPLITDLAVFPER